MHSLAWIVVLCLVGGVLSVIGAAVVLLLPRRHRLLFLPHLVSFAIGALLGAAFLALLPHAIGSPTVHDIHDITGVVLLGILGFFLLEKLVLWRHCHSGECEVHGALEEGEAAHRHGPAPAGVLVLFGDAFHNFVDGIVIGAAFLTDPQLGIVTALAVAAHELPQELGDFAILLESGFSRAKAFVFNVLSSLTTVIGGILAYFGLAAAEEAIPYVLAVAASSFIYIAVADLIPGLHKRLEFRATVQQLVLIGLGVGVIYLAHSSLHGDL